MHRLIGFSEFLGSTQVKLHGHARSGNCFAVVTAYMEEYPSAGFQAYKPVTALDQ